MQSIIDMVTNILECAYLGYIIQYIMALLFIGKLLIAAGIGFQAYTLYEDKAAAGEFSTQLTTVLKSCDIIPKDIQKQILAHLRLVIVGLLAFSGLMVFTRSCLVKVPVLLGLLIVFALRHYPFATVPSYRDQTFWSPLAIIGGVIYLMGAESCGSCSKTAKVTQKPTKSATQEKQEKGGKQKKH